MLYHTIMVPIDGSNESRCAFYKAVNLAKGTDTKLLLTHIVDTRQYQNIMAYDPILAKEAKIEAEEALAEYIEYAQQEGVTIIQPIIKYGSPKEELSYTLPREYHVDLIMIGATGLNAFERLLIGSVSEYVSRHAPCDVTIVRKHKK